MTCDQCCLAVDKVIAVITGGQSFFWTALYVCCLEAEFKRVAVKQYARHALVDCDDDVGQRTIICSHFDHSAPGLLAAASIICCGFCSCYCDN